MSLSDLTTSEVERTHLVVPEDADGFLAAHPRMTGVFARRARGTESTQVEVVDSGSVRTTRTRFGFPVVGELEMHPDYAGFGLVEGGRGPVHWNGHRAVDGDAFFFPPGARVLVSLPDGATIRTASAPMGAIQEAAEDLRRDLRGLTTYVADGPVVGRLRQVWTHHQDRADVESSSSDDVVDGFVELLAAHADPSRARQSDRTIVAAVLNHLEATDTWRLSTPEMCRLAHASERRLQLAFQEIFGMTPTSFLRERALSACREALRARGSEAETVSEIAVRHGFHHLSRFSAAYRRTFGELPSQTRSTSR